MRTEYAQWAFTTRQGRDNEMALFTVKYLVCSLGNFARRFGGFSDSNVVMSPYTVLKKTNIVAKIAESKRRHGMCRARIDGSILVQDIVDRVLTPT